MYEESARLLNWLEDQIHPLKFANSHLTETDFLTIKDGFANQVKIFRRALLKQVAFSERKTAVSMRQLVKASDTVHHYLFRLAPAWNKSIIAFRIKSLYVYTLSSIQTLLEDMGRQLPKIYKQMPITRYALPDLMMPLKKKYHLFLTSLDSLDIDDVLKALVKKGIHQLLCKKEICLLNVEYCYQIINAVLTSDDMDTQMFKELLCINGFNIPEFYMYCISAYKTVMENTLGLHEQLEMIIIEQDKLSSILQPRRTKMIPSFADITEQLQGFLLEKKQHVKQMLKLRRVILQDDQLAKSMTRLKLNMSVAQFGLFIRVQIEKGLLLKENIGEVFNFFAAHFYTPQTMFISAESLRKKSTDVEFNTAQKLKAHLIAMLNWLNENYNLSNFKGS